MRLDHLAVSAGTLDQGVEYVQDLLGVSLAAGGEHAKMGTHNRLLSLGPDIYLEVIAVNPDASAPDRPRWFDIDTFTGAPRLTNWIVQTDDMAATLAALPKGTGIPMDLQRGDLRWQMAIPADGKLPFDGAHPAVISWAGPHPAARLPDQDCRLEGLEIAHPKADELQALLSPLMALDRVSFVQALDVKLTAHVRTPYGLTVLE